MIPEQNEIERQNLQKRYALLGVAAFILTSLVFLITSSVMASPVASWLGRLVGFAGILAYLVAAWLLYQKKHTLGVIIAVLTTGSIVLVNTLLVSGLGLLMGAAQILVLFIYIGVSVDSPLRERLFVYALLNGSLTYLIDFFDFDFLNRLSGTDQSFISSSIILGVLVAGFMVFVALQFKNFSLQNKLITLFMALSFTAFVVIISITSFMVNRELSGRINSDLAQVAITEADELSASLSRQIDTLQALSLNDSVEIGVIVRNQVYEQLYQNNPQAIERRIRDIESLWEGSTDRASLSHALFYDNLNEELEDFIRVFPGFLEIVVIDRYGATLATTDLEEGYYHGRKAWWQETVAQNKPYLGEIELEEGSQKFGLEINVPIFGETTGETIGLIHALYDMQNIVDHVKSINAGRDGAAEIIFFENGKRLSLEDGLALIMPKSFQDQVQILIEDNQPTAEIIYNGVETLATLSSLQVTNALDVSSESQWDLLVYQDKASAFSVVNTLVNTSVFGALLTLIIILFAAFFFARILVEPIQRLTYIAQGVSQGDFSVNAPVESYDEIGRLALSFNQMMEQLQELVESLETKVRERTEDVLISLEVGQQALSIRDVDVLLPQITDFIQQRFDLYYAQVYFVSPDRTYLELRAGTGEVGQALLKRRHALPIDSQSIVGKVALDAAPVVVSDVSQSKIHEPNPLLPDTRSELGVPLMLDDKVIGVLDMQSKHKDTFNLDNLPVFATMATQLAAAIDSAQQLQAAQDAQMRTEETIRRFTQEGWANHLALGYEKPYLGYSYANDSLKSLDPVKPAEEADPQHLAVPLLLRNEAIGQLKIKPKGGRHWSNDERNLLNAVAEKLAQKADNLRLFEATQHRAAREALTRNITDKIRASQDIQTALRVAAEELSQALKVPRAVVDLQISSEISQELEPDTEAFGKEERS